MIGEDLLRPVLIGVIVALALLVRLRRMGRHSRLRLGTLWIIPSIFLALAGAILWQFPPRGLDWLWIALGLVAGGLVGWQRGRLVEISIDPATGRLLQRSSPGALIFLAMLLIIRWLFRSVLIFGDERWHLGAMLVSDIMILFAVGVLGAFRLELYLRGRRLLRAP